MDFEIEALWPTAVHEAGHAVVGHALGYGVTCISTIPSGKTFGRVQAFVEVPPWVPATWAYVAYTLAGHAAVDLLVDPESFPIVRRLGGPSDVDWSSAAFHLDVDDPTDPAVQSAYAWAKGIVRPARRRILAVAERLVEVRQLDGPEACRRAILGRARDTWVTAVQEAISRYPNAV